MKLIAAKEAKQRKAYEEYLESQKPRLATAGGDVKVEKGKDDAKAPDASGSDEEDTMEYLRR